MKDAHRGISLATIFRALSTTVFYHLQIVSCIIDPLLQEVNETASRLPTVDMAVYLLNCMHQIQSTLALYEYMDQRLERLQVIGQFLSRSEATRH